MPTTKYDDYGHPYVVDTFGDKVQSAVEKIKKIPGDIKLSLATSGANRKRLIKTSEKAIALLEKNPESKKAQEGIQKVRDAIVKYELNSDMYGPTISAESEKVFVETLKKINTPETLEVAKEIENELSYHPDMKSNQVQPGEEE